MTRAEILNTAKEIVTNDRNIKYGEPEDNFGRIAVLWEAYLGMMVLREDVAAMMILLKLARIASASRSDDNWIDIAGYAACGGEIQTKIQEACAVDPGEMDWNV